MATRLKRLELHGFKSFATPTTFVFDTGITAVIGPNGSGKSNISDALRWVLGEQSYSNLRGRRTEDIIFAGSSARSPIGMAEVTVTLDNQDGDLPIAFSEVSVTRRAYRSGENQYLINGARVRLKDVLQVTASLGQSHTVIGQGLVDAVLSQRVDERRSLFEHAAGITGLRIKHATAGRNLEESQANCTRLEDLLADLEPRLRSLERAARQAREYDDVKRQLRQALERFYARHWLQIGARLREAQAAVDALAAELNDASTQRDAIRQQADRATQSVAQRASDLEQLKLEIARVRDEHQSLSHNLALIEERRTASKNRRDDAERSLATIQTSIDELAREQADLDETTVVIEQSTATREAQLTSLEADNAESRRRLVDLESRLAAAEQRSNELERASMVKETRLTLLRGQIEQLEVERGRHRDGSAERQAQRSALIEQGQQIDRAEAEISERLERLATQISENAAEIENHVAERSEIASRVSDLERRLMAAGTRYETLKRLEESGVGLYAGVKQVLDASRTQQLTGVLGTLSSLLIVPAELEAAIEAALGGHLQDVVVERWADAENAIQHLKRTQSGRATFHPLDTVRGRSTSAPQRPTPGVRGLASDLIQMDERVRPVIDGLLGRVLVAEDLDAARAAIRSLSPGWSVVTLGGEIARSSGTLTGGSRIKETGALARERELRELPRQRARLEKQAESVKGELEQIDESLRASRSEKQKIELEIGEARTDARDLKAARERLDRQMQELQRAEAAEAQGVARVDQRAASIEHEIDELVRSREHDADSLQAIVDECNNLRQAVERARQATTDEELQRVRRELSGLRERKRGMDEQRRRLDTRRQALQEQRANGDRRLAELDTSIVELDREHDAGVLQRDEMARRRDELQTRFESLRQAHEAAAENERAARQTLVEAEERCRELERRQDHLSLDLARRRDELELTLERAGRDLEESEVETLLSESAPAEADDLPRLEREIGRLRERLRRIGVAGDDAIEQYEREAERYNFLRQQLDDVRSASDALRTLMNELDRTMAAEFDRTFTEVARVFETTFTTLFGGGKARLIRCDDEGNATGIDIVAQPPGKRLQNLGTPLRWGASAHGSRAPLLDPQGQSEPVLLAGRGGRRARRVERGTGARRTTATSEQDPVRRRYTQPCHHRRCRHALRHHDG